MNIPNILTVSRIAMIAVAVVLSAFCGPKLQDITKGIEILRIIVISLAFLAGITDLLDGYLARKWNQVTDFGALMDPLADKIFVAACMLIAVEYRLMPSWIAIAVLAREFMVTGLRSLAAISSIPLALAISNTAEPSGRTANSASTSRKSGSLTFIFSILPPQAELIARAVPSPPSPSGRDTMFQSGAFSSMESLTMRQTS